MINKIVFYYRIHWPILQINLFLKHLCSLYLKAEMDVCYEVDVYLKFSQNKKEFYCSTMQR